MSGVLKFWELEFGVLGGFIVGFYRSLLYSVLRFCFIVSRHHNEMN